MLMAFENSMFNILREIRQKRSHSIYFIYQKNSKQNSIKAEHRLIVYRHWENEESKAASQRGWGFFWG
jgi:hypothetical protein